MSATPRAPPDEAPAASRREVAFALLAIVSVLIGISRLADPRPAAAWLKALDASIAIAFLVDWLRRIRIAQRPGRYAARHSYEVLTFIPFTLIPGTSGADLLRGARLFRLLGFARYGAYAKVGLGLTRFPRRLRYVRRVVKHAQLVTIVLVGVVVVALGAFGLLLTEGESAGLHGFEQALWWSLNLFTTVAYAVPSPTTSAGYVVSGALMVLGIGFVGVFTASLANALLRTSADEE